MGNDVNANPEGLFKTAGHLDESAGSLRSHHEAARGRGRVGHGAIGELFQGVVQRAEKIVEDTTRTVTKVYEDSAEGLRKVAKQTLEDDATARSEFDKLERRQHDDVHSRPGVATGAVPSGSGDPVADTLSALRHEPGSPGRGTAGRFWTPTDYNGQRVYQRDDLVDPSYVSRRDKYGRTNLKRMQQGLAPMGPDDRPINLHHMLQTQRGPIAEITHSMHFDSYTIVHWNVGTKIPSGIDRRAFTRWKKQYWKDRAVGFLP